MALWRSWLARRPVTAEVAGSSPVRVASFRASLRYSGGWLFACSPGRKFLVKFPGHLLRATVQHFTVGCDLGHMVKGT